MMRGVYPPVPPALHCTLALHHVTCCGVGLTPQLVLCYAGVRFSSGWSGAAGSVITLMWGIGGEAILVAYPNRNTAMTYDDNEVGTVDSNTLPVEDRRGRHHLGGIFCSEQHHRSGGATHLLQLQHNHRGTQPCCLPPCATPSTPRSPCGSSLGSGLLLHPHSSTYRSAALSCDVPPSCTYQPRA
jgi:hypothetical protein